MFRNALGKVAWVGRTASMVFGLALVMALVLGATSVALAGNLDPLKIGSLKNVATKTTQLLGKVAAGEALVVKNPSGGSALGLSVGDPAADPATKAVAPMKVDSQARVDNLNADKVDGQDSTTLLPGGDLPKDRTLRGHYNIYDKSSPQQSGQENMPISFGYRLASAPTVRIIKANTSPPAECPGTASAPEAASGYLCIYETSSYNLYSSPYRTYPYVYGTSRIGAHIAADGAVNTGTTYDSTFYTYGTWAVTGN